MSVGACVGCTKLSREDTCMYVHFTAFEYVYSSIVVSRKSRSIDLDLSNTKWPN